MNLVFAKKSPTGLTFKTELAINLKLLFSINITETETIETTTDNERQKQ